MKLPDRLDPSFLLRAYAAGIFPMGDDEGDISWYAPDPRAVLEHDDLVVSRSLRAVLRSRRFDLRFSSAFENVMRACAEPRSDGNGIWITAEFVTTYTALHRAGYAHSVEAWRDDHLVGGLYGVAVGGAFMGESMFSRESNASKVCLVALVERLRERGYVLHDTQFLTPHLARMGASLVSRAVYERRLRAAIVRPCRFL